MKLDADLVGVAAVNGFSAAPEECRPDAILPGCCSVVVIACAFPGAMLEADAETYTAARNEMIKRINAITAKVAKKIIAEGFAAKQITAIGTRGIKGRQYGTISLKHAAVLAGLGVIGKNTLLVNGDFGNLLWLGAVLTDMPLQPDAPAKIAACPKTCRLCVDNCPANALADPLINQRGCYNHGFKTVDGKLRIQCWKCREICPRRFGAKKERKTTKHA